MDFDAAIKSVGLQFAVVAAAPIPFAISLAILSAAVWQICRWYYEGRISSLEGRLAFKVDEVTTLKEAAAMLEVDQASKQQNAKQAVKFAGPVDIANSPEDLALIKMAKVLRSAEIEQSLAKGGFANRSVPALKASILTASKLFGIVESYPAPDNHGGPLTLNAGIALLRQVLPLLQDGHFDEARRLSQKLHDDEANRSAKASTT